LYLQFSITLRKYLKNKRSAEIIPNVEIFLLNITKYMIFDNIKYYY